MLRKWIEPPTWVHLIVNGAVPSERRAWNILNKARGIVANWLPRYSRSQEAATHTLRRVLVNEPLVRELAMVAPELGLRLLAHEIPERDVFLDKWVSSLLRDRASVLYYEIEHNQNTGLGGRYHYPEANRVIYALLRDAKRAEELAIYKPLGDFVIRRFGVKFRKGGADRYNDALDDFYDRGRGRDPVHAVLRSFDFMVSEAAYQGVQWHMWLYYVPLFVEKIERNVQPSKDVDITNEWPTPYHYFLYDCFTLLWSWIGIAKEIRDGRPHSSPESVDTEHENENIPKSAGIALGQAWFTVAESTRIHDRFKKYLLEATLSRLNRLRGADRIDQFRTVAIRSLMIGGWRTGRTLEDHQHRMRALLGSVDHVLRGDIEDELQQHYVV